MVVVCAFPSIKSKKTLGDRAFMFAAPKLWNALPIDIRTTNTVEGFKCEILKEPFVKILLIFYEK